ncbi:MAG: succinic semialdehyde dehydrogenase [Microthrixaceae bacterium]|nr:succinic semialdehyde dehydrogenase [Microthrixaceae bacterium]
MTTTATPADIPGGSSGLTADGSLPPSITSELVGRLTGSVRSSGDASVTTHAPFSGAVIAELPQCVEADVIGARERAVAARRLWAARPVGERAEVFLAMHDLVLDNSEVLMDLIQAENGKARRDAYLEVADIAITCRYYARTAPRALAPKVRTGIIPLVTSVRELRHPRGIVTVISPWNYPLSLAAGDTIPALLAGNAVVQKPDNQTALTALYARELAVRAGLPEDLWQIVLGRGSNIGTPLLDIADYVMFTGSTASGRRIAAQCGERLVDSSMELGGKNAMIVMADADLDRTVEGAVRACFSSSGQLCISIERMYVADAIWDRFVPRFLEAVDAMNMAPVFDFSAQMGSLTSAEQLDAVTTHVTDAVERGATVLTGGRARPDLGPYFHEPTVLTGVDDSMTCFAQETFGPVVSLYRYSDVDEAIEWANDTEYGLNASVWARDSTRGREVAAQMKAGTVNLNEAYAAAWGSIDAPMGGMGQSGMGRRHGVGGITKYTEVQTVAHQRFMNLAPVPGLLDDEGFAKVLSTSLRVLKRLGWR